MKSCCHVGEELSTWKKTGKVARFTCGRLLCHLGIGSQLPNMANIIAFLLSSWVPDNFSDLGYLCLFLTERVCGINLENEVYCSVVSTLGLVLCPLIHKKIFHKSITTRTSLQINARKPSSKLLSPTYDNKKKAF